MKRRRTHTNPFLGPIPEHLVTALRKAAADLNAQGIPFVVIGGVAISYRFPIYPTEDVDLAVESEANVPERLEGLKRATPHGFEDRASGVLVEIVTAQHVRVPQAVFDFALQTSDTDTTLGVPVRVASRLAIFALKMCAGRERPRHKDMAHMIWMIRHGFDPDPAELLLAGVPMGRIQILAEVRVEAAREAREEGWGGEA